MTVDFGPWASLTVDDAAAVLSGAPFRWWVTGGQALELYAGESWRAHVDLDLGFPRAQAPAIQAFLQGFDLHVFAAGALRRWRGEPLDASLEEHNLWCRRSAESPWLLDLTAAEGDERDWTDRLENRIRVPWGEAVLRSPAGIPFLAPEIVLLGKSRQVRPKDDQDAECVFPWMETRRQRRLARWLPPDHPWQSHACIGPADLPSIRLRVPLNMGGVAIPARTTLRVLDFLMDDDFGLLCEAPNGDRVQVDRETVRTHAYTPRIRRIGSMRPVHEEKSVP